MKTLRKHRVLAVTVMLVVVVALAGTAGARYFGSTQQEAMAQHQLKMATAQSDLRAGAASGGMAFTVGGLPAPAAPAEGSGVLPAATQAAAPTAEGPRIVKT